MLLGAWPLGGKNVSSLTNNHGKARLFILCGSYILYLVIGASIIGAIEIPPIEQDSTKLNSLRAKFLQNNKCVKGTYTKLSDFQSFWCRMFVFSVENIFTV